jgi:hypothetical protein
MANAYWRRMRQHAGSVQLGGGSGSLKSARRQWRQHNQQSTKSVGSYGNGNGNDGSNDDEDKNKGDGSGGGSLAAARQAAQWDRGCGGSFISAQRRQRSGAAAAAKGCSWLTSRKSENTILK